MFEKSSQALHWPPCLPNWGVLKIKVPQIGGFRGRMQHIQTFSNILLQHFGAHRLTGDAIGSTVLIIIRLSESIPILL